MGVESRVGFSRTSRGSCLEQPLSFSSRWLPGGPGSISEFLGLIAVLLAAEQGYVLSDFQIIDDDDSVVFGKMLTEGICCLIDFQRSRHYIPPILGFQVFLMREQLTDSVRSNVCYAPLGIGLRNIMRGLHHVDIFAPGVYAWEFIDRQSLEERLEHAISLMLMHGISWLEDRDSNMDWTQNTG
jgi:hypothetical protein